MQKKLSDFRQEVQDLEDGRKKLEIELDQKKNIDGALDYLKESNSKAANKIYYQEEQLKENKQVQLEQKQLLEIEQTKNKLLTQQNEELQIEIDRIKFNSADQSSLNNISTIS